MGTERISAVFPSLDEADRAVIALRRNGVRDEHLAFVSPQWERAGDFDGQPGSGMLFGLPVGAVCGDGAFVTSGWLSNSLAGSAGVGDCSVAEALTRAGYSESEARFYGSGVEGGGVLVAVDAGREPLAGDPAAEDAVTSALLGAGGRSVSAPLLMPEPAR